MIDKKLAKKILEAYDIVYLFLKDVLDIEEEKAEKYNPDDLFKKKKIETEEDSEKTEKISNLPIEVKKEKLFEKIINFFKKILNNV